MECIYTLGTSSASHTYGNVASFLKVTLEEYFPQDYFRAVHMDSKIAWRNISDTLGGGGREFKSRKYPFMIMSPRFSDIDTSRYLYGTPLTKNLDDVEAGVRRNTLFPVFKDKEKRLEIAYKLNRDIVNFDIEIRVETLSQQIDLYKNLENQLIWERPFMKPASLEAMIPRAMVAYATRLSGIEISGEEATGNVPMAIQYLNRHARNPITYKVRSNQGIEEFFLYYNANILTTFSDLNMGDAVKRSSIDQYYSITFRVAMEFNLPGMFALIGDSARPFNGMKFDIKSSADDGLDSPLDIIPVYTFTNLYNKYSQGTMDGFQFYSTSVVKTEECNDGKEDSVPFSDLIAPTHLEIIKGYVRDGIAPETLFRFRLLEDVREIPCNVTREMYQMHWTVDWVREQITIFCPNSTATYRVVIHANMVHINERLSRDMQQNKVDKPHL